MVAPGAKACVTTLSILPLLLYHSGGEPESACLVGDQPPWEVLGFSAANPAGDLGDTGLLCLLLLLLLLDRAPDLAARLLAASGVAAAQPGPQQQKQSPGFCLAEVAVEATGWVQRALAGGSLAKDGSFHRAGVLVEMWWVGTGLRAGRSWIVRIVTVRSWTDPSLLLPLICRGILAGSCGRLPDVLGGSIGRPGQARASAGPASPAAGCAAPC